MFTLQKKLAKLCSSFENDDDIACAANLSRRITLDFMNFLCFLVDIVTVNLVIIVNGFLLSSFENQIVVSSKNNNGITATVLPLTPHFWHILVAGINRRVVVGYCV